jgi:hypothetical protein
MHETATNLKESIFHAFPSDSPIITKLHEWIDSVEERLFGTIPAAEANEDDKQETTIKEFVAQGTIEKKPLSDPLEGALMNETNTQGTVEKHNQNHEEGSETVEEEPEENVEEKAETIKRPALNQE